MISDIKIKLELLKVHSQSLISHVMNDHRIRSVFCITEGESGDGFNLFNDWLDYHVCHRGHHKPERLYGGSSCLILHGQRASPDEITIPLIKEVFEYKPERDFIRAATFLVWDKREYYKDDIFCFTRQAGRLLKEILCSKQDILDGICDHFLLPKAFFLYRMNPYDNGNDEVYWTLFLHLIGWNKRFTIEAEKFIFRNSIHSRIMINDYRQTEHFSIFKEQDEDFDATPNYIVSDLKTDYIIASQVLLTSLCILVDRLTVETESSQSIQYKHKDKELVIMCEGTYIGKKRKCFDQKIYTKIFSETHPEAGFFSGGGSNDLKKVSNTEEALSQAHPDAVIIKLIDRDDQSDAEVGERLNEGMKVLSKRNLECYLLSDEILMIFIDMNDSNRTEELLSQIAEIKADCNPIDDYKDAKGLIVNLLKRELKLKGSGSTADVFMAERLAPLINGGTETYKELEMDIFGYNILME